MNKEELENIVKRDMDAIVEFTRISEQLRSAREVIEFYADHGNWRWDEPNPSDAVSIVDGDWNSFKTPYNKDAKRGGKRAREWLRKNKDNE